MSLLACFGFERNDSWQNKGFWWLGEVCRTWLHWGRASFNSAEKAVDWDAESMRETDYQQQVRLGLAGFDSPEFGRADTAVGTQGLLAESEFAP